MPDPPNIAPLIHATLREMARRRRILPFIPTLTLDPAELLEPSDRPLRVAQREEDRRGQVLELQQPHAAVERERGAPESLDEVSDRILGTLEHLDGSTSALERDGLGAHEAIASVDEGAFEERRDDADADEQAG